MKTEKMTYEKPTVQKVEFDYKANIAASECTTAASPMSDCHTCWDV